MHTIITRYMRTNSTLGDWTLETAPAYTSTLPKALDAINLPGKAWGDTSMLKCLTALSSLMTLMEQISATSYCLAGNSQQRHACTCRDGGMTEDQLRLQGLSYGMLRFHEDLVNRMF